MVFAIYHTGVREGHKKFTCAGLGPMPFTKALAPSTCVFVYFCRVYKLFSSQIPIPLYPFSLKDIEKEQSVELQYFGKSWI